MDRVKPLFLCKAILILLLVLQFGLLITCLCFGTESNRNSAHNEHDMGPKVILTPNGGIGVAFATSDVDGMVLTTDGEFGVAIGE